MAVLQTDGIITGVYADGETNWGATMDANLKAIGWLLTPGQINVNVNTPPAAVVNDRVTVGAAPTGVFVGRAGNYARYTGSAWEFMVAVTNATVLNFTTGTWFKFNGTTWVAV